MQANLENALGITFHDVKTLVPQIKAAYGAAKQ